MPLCRYLLFASATAVDEEAQRKHLQHATEEAEEQREPDEGHVPLGAQRACGVRIEFVCVCVCVYERDRERKKERERVRESEGVFKSKCKCV